MEKGSHASRGVKKGSQNRSPSIQVSSGGRTQRPGEEDNIGRSTTKIAGILVKKRSYNGGRGR